MKFTYRTLRVLTQSLSFLFLLYLILQTAFPLEIRFPVDLYLRLDPFIGLISLLAQKEFILRMLPSLGVLLLVVVVGNFFCGWFCPMGAAIDFFDRVLFREKKRAKTPDDQPLRRVRYGVFAFALTAGLLGWQLMFLLDPISLITRTLVIAVYPPVIYVSNQLIPLIQKFFPQNPFILSATPLPVFKVNLLIFFFFVAVLSLGVIRRRFWCRYLCPLGTFFSLTSRLRLFRRSVSRDCTHCLKCAKNCPVGAIPGEEPETYRLQDCIACLRCTDCPPGPFPFA